eukprot:symbB.v1.2.025594.t1/scaffold2493.1/size77834/7
MLQKVIERRGTPTEEVWKDVSALPNFLEFTPHPKVPLSDPPFQRVSSAFRAFLDDLLALDPKQRPKAHKALNHEFFETKVDCEPHQLPFVKGTS